MAFHPETRHPRAVTPGGTRATLRPGVCLGGARIRVPSVGKPGHTPGNVKLLLPPRQSRGNSQCISGLTGFRNDQEQAGMKFRPIHARSVAACRLGKSSRASLTSTPTCGHLRVPPKREMLFCSDSLDRHIIPKRQAFLARATRINPDAAGLYSMNRPGFAGGCLV
jgi:hypothetical protein